jgi:hypothetical protein
MCLQTTRYARPAWFAAGSEISRLGGDVGKRQYSEEEGACHALPRRFCKKQQMQWRKRDAHLLLQTWAKTLNDALGAVFKS